MSLRVSDFLDLIRKRTKSAILALHKKTHKGMINWKDHIHSNEEVLLGKPVIKGTRISVEFILERLANGWTEQEILENYPRFTKDGLQAVFSYIYECMKDGMLYFPKMNRA